MLGLIFYTVVGSIGLYAIGHVLPGTKPYCRRMSKKMWRYTGAKGKQAWQANRAAKRKRQERRFATDPKAQARNRRRTEKKQQPLRLTVGHRPRSGESVVDKVDRTRIDRSVRRRGRQVTQPQPQSRSEPPWASDRTDARHTPHPQDGGGNGGGGGTGTCGARTKDGTACQRLINTAGNCGIKSHDSKRPRDRKPPRNGTGNGETGPKCWNCGGKKNVTSTPTLVGSKPVCSNCAKRRKPPRRRPTRSEV